MVRSAEIPPSAIIDQKPAATTCVEQCIEGCCPGDELVSAHGSAARSPRARSHRAPSDDRLNRVSPDASAKQRRILLGLDRTLPVDVTRLRSACVHGKALRAVLHHLHNTGKAQSPRSRIATSTAPPCRPPLLRTHRTQKPHSRASVQTTGGRETRSRAERPSGIAGSPRA